MAKSKISEEPPTPALPPHLTHEANTRLRASLAEIDSVDDENDLLLWLSSALNDNKEKLEDFGSWDLKAENVVRKKRSSESIHGSSSKTDHVAGNIRKTKGQSSMARIMEGGLLESSLWRGCVEPRTYLYVPENGQYRKSKAVVQKILYQRPPWKPSIGEKILTQEQKNLQREIQRELRREFDMTKTQGQWANSEKPETHTKKVIRAPVRSFMENSKDVKEPLSNRNVKHLKTVDENISGKSQVKRGALSTTKGPPRRAASPVALPPISVPLVNKNLVKNKLSESFSGSLELNTADEYVPNVKHSVDSQVTLRTRRSSSEPPPPASTASYKNRDGPENLEVGNPARRGPDSEIVHRTHTRSTTVPHQKRIARSGDHEPTTKREPSKAWTKPSSKVPESNTADSVLANIVLNSKGLPGQISEHHHPHHHPPHNSNKNHDQSDTSKPKPKDRTSRRDSHEDSTTGGATILTSQLRYMSASGEVSIIPQLGQTSRSSSFYKTLEREDNRSSGAGSPPQSYVDVRSNKENLHAVITTSKVVSRNQGKVPAQAQPPQPTQARHTSGATTGEYLKLTRSYPTKISGVIPANTQANHMTTNSDSFRGNAIGQSKSRDRKTEVTVAPPSLDFLPQIAGRKCDLTATSHRVV